MATHTKLIALEDPVVATARNEEALKRKGSCLGEGGAAAAADGPADGDRVAVATATEKRKRPRK